MTALDWAGEGVEVTVGGVEIPLMETEDLLFFTERVEELVSSLATESFSGETPSIEFITQKYLLPAVGGLDDGLLPVALAIMFATAVQKLVGQAQCREQCLRCG